MLEQEIIRIFVAWFNQSKLSYEQAATRIGVCKPVLCKALKERRATRETLTKMAGMLLSIEKPRKEWKRNTN